MTQFAQTLIAAATVGQVGEQKAQLPQGPRTAAERAQALYDSIRKDTEALRRGGASELAARLDSLADDVARCSWVRTDATGRVMGQYPGNAELHLKTIKAATSRLVVTDPQDPEKRVVDSKYVVAESSRRGLEDVLRRSFGNLKGVEQSLQTFGGLSASVFGNDAAREGLITSTTRGLGDAAGRAQSGKEAARQAKQEALAQQYRDQLPREVLDAYGTFHQTNARGETVNYHLVRIGQTQVLFRKAADDKSYEWAPVPSGTEKPQFRPVSERFVSLPPGKDPSQAGPLEGTITFERGYVNRICALLESIPDPTKLKFDELSKIRADLRLHTQYHEKVADTHPGALVLTDALMAESLPNKGASNTDGIFEVRVGHYKIRFWQDPRRGSTGEWLFMDYSKGTLGAWDHVPRDLIGANERTPEKESLNALSHVLTQLRGGRNPGDPALGLGAPIAEAVAARDMETAARLRTQLGREVVMGLGNLHDGRNSCTEIHEGADVRYEMKRAGHVISFKQNEIGDWVWREEAPNKETAWSSMRSTYGASPELPRGVFSTEARQLNIFAALLNQLNEAAKPK
ncbi:MAG: hypothetical protein U0136_12070 [Bdellovibrionota bacterium]